MSVGDQSLQVVPSTWWIYMRCLTGALLWMILLLKSEDLCLRALGKQSDTLSGCVQRLHMLLALQHDMYSAAAFEQNALLREAG